VNSRPARIVAAISEDSARYASPFSNSITGSMRWPLRRSTSFRLLRGRLGSLTTS
jgi:hypothetical protein